MARVFRRLSEAVVLCSVGRGPIVCVTTVDVGPIRHHSGARNLMKAVCNDTPSQIGIGIRHRILVLHGMVGLQDSTSVFLVDTLRGSRDFDALAAWDFVTAAHFALDARRASVADFHLVEHQVSSEFNLMLNSSFPTFACLLSTTCAVQYACSGIVRLDFAPDVLITAIVQSLGLERALYFVY
jgi:hypothetical protein